MRQHRFQGLEEIATGACLTSTNPKTLHLKACSLGPRRNWNRGCILQSGLKIVGPFYSGAMPAALATARIQTVGAFYNRDWKSWAHWIAGLCLQPWPQKALKSWRILQWRIEIVGTFYSRAMPAAKATARNGFGACKAGTSGNFFQGCQHSPAIKCAHDFQSPF